MSQNNDTYTEITNTLIAIHAEADTTPRISPKALLAHLEKLSTLRPSHINDILRAFASHYPTDLLILLDTYMLELEEQQLTQSAESTMSRWDISNPPHWSHQKSMKRRQRRHEREIKKITNSY